MTKNFVLLTLGLLSLTSCNLYGGIDSPSGDEQLLSAARGAFDHGDYTKALEYYQQLSNSKADIRISETAMVTMAQNEIFSMSDLIGSLGNSRGNGGSIVTIANSVAGRGKTDAAYRTILDQLYVDAGAIVDPKLQAYTRFIIAMAMTTHVLANAAGADGVVTKGDISTSPNSCTVVTCAYPGGNNMTDTSTGGNPTSPWNGSAVDANWGNSASLDMLITASKAADTNFTALTGGSGLGITQALGQMGNAGATPAARRFALITTLFP